MSDWSAAVLAGGRGRRLGGVVKPLLTIDGRTILDRQRAALAGLGETPRLVAPDATPFAGCGLVVTTDLVDAGALGALYTALATATTPYVLAIAGDLPFVTAPFLAALVERRHEADAVIPSPGGRPQPLCAVYATSVAPVLAAAITAGRLRVIDAVASLRARVLDDTALAAFDADGRLLLNVNTRDDEAAARRFAGEGKRHDAPTRVT
ncbi:MAG: molybdenum cofactor guanylyltransferase [Vicinamibacterales bacterium]